MSARLLRLASGRLALPRWLGAALLAGLLLAGCTPKPTQTWALTDIRGYLPDLKVRLQTADGKPLTATELRGRIVVLYFGYTHCPDVCPMTLGRIASAVKGLGPAADAVRILFISVDPQRDTPKLVEHYAQAFSDRAIGATGTPAEIERLAKRYRVAYQSEKPDRDGNYEVMHSKAVYLFDRQGRARLMGTDTDPAAAFAHDLKQLIAEKP
jgi:protein SCO1/2